MALNDLPSLKRGDLVVAIDIPSEVADVPSQTIGVVFEPAGFHEPNTGPMVRFVNGCACNVYDGYVKPL